METIKAFEKIETIQIETPVNKIITQIRTLITSGQLKPGDRLPAERILAERFGVGRGYIREAILKLEFYGLLKTSPQSGTYVSGLSIKILDSIFSDIINFNKNDFASMVEARFYLEKNAAKLAAERRTDDDIMRLKEALASFDSKINKGQPAIEEDLIFHIGIAGASKNSVIESMILIIIPDLISFKKRADKDRVISKTNKAVIAQHKQHHNILEAIIKKDAKGADNAMSEHLSEIMSVRTKF